jgi:hypothetical protein
MHKMGLRKASLPVKPSLIDSRGRKLSALTVIPMVSNQVSAYCARLAGGGIRPYGIVAPSGLESLVYL